MTEVTVGSFTPVESKYEWKIPNFRSYASYKSGQFLFSPYFHTLNDDKKLQWRLKMYPTGNEERYISVYLQNCNEFEVIAKYGLTIISSEVSNFNISRINSAGSVFIPKGATKDTSQRAFSAWGWPEFVERNVLFSEQSDFLADDTLTISCCIFDTRISLDNQESDNNKSSEAYNRFENLLETGKFGDVTFIIGEKKMQLHKAILIGASPVFQAMFAHEMIEQKDNVVNIVDIDFDVMKEMFRFIYAKKVNDIDELAYDLLVAAHKYCLTELEQLCEKTLCGNMDATNAIQYLKLSIRYDVKTLKSVTVDFVLKNLKFFVDKEEFKSLTTDCMHELLRNIANNQ